MEPEEYPAMPPISFTVSLISFISETDFVSSTLPITVEAENSTGMVFTSALFDEEKMFPSFSPAMPPTFVLPVTLPENVQSVMMPVESFSPVMPPTLFSPSTLPVNAAGDNASAVVSRDTSDVFLDSVGGDASCDAEILYLTAASDMPEQAEVGAAVVDFQVLYGMSLSVKSSAENGNAFVVFFREVNVVLKKYGFALRPCVERAFFRRVL